MPSPAGRDLIWSSKTSANDGTTYTAFNISSDSLSDVESNLANPCGRQGEVSPLTYSFLAILGSGPGIIVLPIALYLLGWVAGLIAMLVVATITWYTSLLLAQTYGQGRLADGSRNYTDAVSHFLGRKYAFTYSLLRGVDDLGGTVPVTVVGGAVMGFIQRINCAKRSSDDAPHPQSCKVDFNTFFIIFGAIQIALSQLPKPAHTTTYAAIGLLTVGYSTILVILICKLIHDFGPPSGNERHSWGPINGSSEDTPQTVWHVFQAVGIIAYAFSFADMVPQIQNTISPCDKTCINHMKKAISVAIPFVTVLYILVASLGYITTASFTLTELVHNSPHWMLDLALIMLLLSAVGIYQAVTEEFHQFLENFAEHTSLGSTVLHKNISITVWEQTLLSCTLFGILWRSAFVCASTVLAILLPFFEDLVGIVGPLQLFSTTIFFPVQMHIQQAQVPAWTGKWVALRALITICLCATVTAIMGSVVSLVHDLKGYKAFSNTVDFPP